MQKTRGTLMGVAAIVLWSLMTGLLRIAMEGFGELLGAPLIYTLGAGVLFAVYRPTPLREVPWRYLVVGGLLFVAYEACMVLAIGLAVTGEQTVEVSILNYLWPALMVLLWVALRRGPVVRNLLRVLPGVVVAVGGIVLAVGGRRLAQTGTPFAGVLSNPLPYGLALSASVIWAVYSTATPAMAGPCNAVAYFFAGVACVLWALFALAGFPMPNAVPGAGAWFALGASALVVAAGYALWNRAIQGGDMRALSATSYCAPVFSSVASSIILQVVPGPLFWVGAALVVAGSLACWHAMGSIEGDAA